MTRPNNAIDHCCDTCLVSPRIGSVQNQPQSNAPWVAASANHADAQPASETSHRPSSDTKCVACKTLCSLGLQKPFVKRMVLAAHDFKRGGEGKFLVTTAELAMYTEKTENAPPGTTIRLPGQVKFRVDDSMVKCVACENETFAVQAEGEGWDHSTGGDGEPAMLCPDCIPAEPVEM